MHSVLAWVWKPQGIPALPFYHVSLTASRTPPSACPKELSTLGDSSPKEASRSGTLAKGSGSATRRCHKLGDQLGERALLSTPSPCSEGHQVPWVRPRSLDKASASGSILSRCIARWGCAKRTWRVSFASIPSPWLGRRKGRGTQMPSHELILNSFLNAWQPHHNA